jgi:hypothetical protein
MSSVPAGTSLRFGANSNSTTDFTNLTSTGFTLGNGAEANTNNGTYWYAAWQGKTYGQADYRIFNNADSTDVGTPLASQDTAATLRATDQPFRLRALVHDNNDTLYASGENFKLQYAPKSGSCDTGFSGESYSDVTGSSTIAYYDNPTPADGNALTSDADDPVDGSNTTVDQTYEEANSFTNAHAAVSPGEDGEWDFSLTDNGAPANTAYCFRIVKADGSLLESYSDIPEVITSDGAFSTDIVDASGNSVSSPSVTMSPITANFACTTSSGVLGTSTQRIRVLNHSADPQWTLSIAATGGNTALWSGGAGLYDFNDPSGSPPGCAAGGDSDTYAGLLGFDFGSAAITPESGCSTTGVSFGGNANFEEGVTDAVTLGTAGSPASSGCYWDFENVGLNQQIPAGQPGGSYSLNLTVTLVAD